MPSPTPASRSSRHEDPPPRDRGLRPVPRPPGRRLRRLRAGRHLPDRRQDRRRQVQHPGCCLLRALRRGAALRGRREAAAQRPLVARRARPASGWSSRAATAAGASSGCRRTSDCKRNGHGTTKSPAEARLEEWVDGGWVGRAARPVDVANELGPILGLNQQQFLQVILLAQGRFARFLLAKNDERQALLRTLFDSHRFEGYEEALERRRRETADRLTLENRILLVQLENAERLATTGDRRRGRRRRVASTSGSRRGRPRLRSARPTRESSQRARAHREQRRTRPRTPRTRPRRAARGSSAATALARRSRCSRGRAEAVAADRAELSRARTQRCCVARSTPRAERHARSTASAGDDARPRRGRAGEASRRQAPTTRRRRPRRRSSAPQGRARGGARQLEGQALARSASAPQRDCSPRPTPSSPTSTRGARASRARARR